MENWRNFVNEEEDLSPKDKEAILRTYNSGGRDNRLLALDMAKTFDIDFTKMQKDYKETILQMLKKPKEVANAIKLYKSVGMGNLLTDTNLGSVNLSNADLSGANLRDASLTKANLEGANLEGANLEGTDLSFANLSGADLSYADLTDATGIDTAIGITPEDIQNNLELYKETKWPEDFYHETYN
jgi:uncharacterized protein YjbI with pentapeptide repeats